MTVVPAHPLRRLAVLAAGVAIAAAACTSAGSSPLPTLGPVTPEPTKAPHPSIAPSAVPSGGLAGCPTSAADITPLKPGETRTVTLETTAGTIVTEVSGDLAPLAAGNYVDLASCGYYDGVVFHRIVPGFVIQAGDGQFGRTPITAPEMVGRGGPGYEFPDEPVVGEYVRGTLAMANGGPDTNGSQFFIVLDDLTGRLGKDYTIFGKVTEGMDVVDTIAAAPQTSTGSEAPVDPVEITKATVAP
jgi:cyclophilin family peptidyl-prolyl cis-trans isomerase